MGAVKDFRILALSVDHISDNGDITYYYETLYIQDYMTPDCPIVVRMTFAGSFPNYGFAFTDANGDEYMYALYLSGMDGSVGIEPIKWRVDYKMKSHGRQQVAVVLCCILLSANHSTAKASALYCKITNS